MNFIRDIGDGTQNSLISVKEKKIEGYACRTIQKIHLIFFKFILNPASLFLCVILNNELYS